jgi:hypothetical protein
MGIEVHYELVSRNHPQLKEAHALSQGAFNQILKPEWRPVGKTGPALTSHGATPPRGKRRAAFPVAPRVGPPGQASRS